MQARVNDIKNSKDLTAFETQYLLQIQPQAQGEKVAQGIEHMTSKQVLMLPDAARENPLLQAHLDKLKNSRGWPRSPQKDLSSQAENESEALCYEEELPPALFPEIDKLFYLFTEFMEEENALFSSNPSDSSCQRQLEGDISDVRGGAGPSHPQPLSFGLGGSDSGRLDSEAMAGFLNDHEIRHGDETIPEDNREDNRFSKRPRREETRTDEALQSSLICHESLHPKILRFP